MVTRLPGTPAKGSVGRYSAKWIRFSKRTSPQGALLACDWRTLALPSWEVYFNNSTVANGSADHGRKRLSVNFVGCPGFTYTFTKL